jgi:hypothetical protein
MYEGMVRDPTQPFYLGGFVLIRGRSLSYSLLLGEIGLANGRPINVCPKRVALSRACFMPSPSPPTSPSPKRITRLPSSPLNPDVLLPDVAPSPSSSNGALSPAAVAPDNKRKSSAARDLLRKHYGLGVGPPSRLPPGRNADPMDLGVCPLFATLDRVFGADMCRCLRAFRVHRFARV